MGEGGVGNDGRVAATLEVDDASAPAASEIDGLELAVGDDTLRREVETAVVATHAIGKVRVGEGEGFEVVNLEDAIISSDAVGVETAVVDGNAGVRVGSYE